MITGELANWWTENIGGSNSSKNIEKNLKIFEKYLTKGNRNAIVKAQKENK